MGLNSSETRLLSILSGGWLYRGEGNANIVLSLPKTHQILRIRKRERPKTILEWFLDWLVQIFKWDNKKDVECERRNLDFYNLVMRPLFGKALTSPAASFNTKRSEIQKLDKELLLLRPEKRKHKCLQFGMATLFMDYTFLPKAFDFLDTSGATYSVEIKPKQGWIPVVDRKFDKCQFCLTQYFKLKNTKVKAVSSYCPLDLFSGDKKRMLKAIKSLIMNPQNNFRFFRDGILCYGENISVQTFYNVLYQLFEPNENSINSLIDYFCEFIEQALLKNLNGIDGCVNCDCKINPLPHETTYINNIEQNKCIFTEQNLPFGCILERLLSLQKLNRFGLNKYCDMYNALIRNDFKFDDWSYVEKFLQEMNKDKVLCPKCIITKRADKVEKILENEEGALSDLDLVPYLIATVANDCSFMLTFRKINKFEPTSNHFILNLGNSNYLVNVGIFDLDPRPVSRFDKHVNRNMKVQEAYLLKQSVAV